MNGCLFIAAVILVIAAMFIPVVIYDPSDKNQVDIFDKCQYPCNMNTETFSINNDRIWK